MNECNDNNPDISFSVSLHVLPLHELVNVALSALAFISKFHYKFIGLLHSDKDKIPFIFLVLVYFFFAFFRHKNKIYSTIHRGVISNAMEPGGIIGMFPNSIFITKVKKIPCVEVTLVCKNTFYTVSVKFPVFPM